MLKRLTIILLLILCCGSMICNVWLLNRVAYFAKALELSLKKNIVMSADLKMRDLEEDTEIEEGDRQKEEERIMGLLEEAFPNQDENGYCDQCHSPNCYNSKGNEGKFWGKGND